MRPNRNRQVMKALLPLLFCFCNAPDILPGIRMSSVQRVQYHSLRQIETNTHSRCGHRKMAAKSDRPKTPPDGSIDNAFQTTNSTNHGSSKGTSTSSFPHQTTHQNKFTPMNQTNPNIDLPAARHLVSPPPPQYHQTGGITNRHKRRQSYPQCMQTRSATGSPFHQSHSSRKKYN